MAKGVTKVEVVKVDPPKMVKPMEPKLQAGSPLKRPVRHDEFGFPLPQDMRGIIRSDVDGSRALRGKPFFTDERKVQPDMTQLYRDKGGIGPFGDLKDRKLSIVNLRGGNR